MSAPAPPCDHSCPNRCRQTPADSSMCATSAKRLCWGSGCPNSAPQKPKKVTLKEATEAMIGPLPAIPFPKTPREEYRGWAEELLAEAKQHNAVSLQVKNDLLEPECRKKHILMLGVTWKICSTS